ncbi:MAG: fimbria major subunit [Odoribacter sp.]|nr:fimbria major subunit [Odoribacter sp.]
MKKLNLLISALVILMFTSCDKKDSVKIETGSGEPVLATFKITAPEGRAVSGSEDGTADENKISVIEFYMFDANGDRDEKTSAYDYSYHKYEGTASEISFLVKSGVNKKILVAVNTDLGANEGLNYDAVEKLLEQTLLTNANSQQIEAGKFVMSGKKVATIEENRTDNEVSISIARLVSKVEPPKLNDDFEVTIPNQDLQTVFADSTVTNANIEFAMTGYALINGYNTSYVYTYYNAEDKEYTDWDMWTPGGTYQKTTFDAANNNDIAIAYSGVQANSPWLSSANVFVYENQPSDTTDTATGIEGFVKDEVYAFLVRGTLTNTINSQSVVRYWRVNLIRDDNYKMFRNTIYRVTLDEVSSIGYGTAKEAEEDQDNGGIVPRNDQTGIQASIDIVPWNVRTQNTDF